MSNKGKTDLERRGIEYRYAYSMGYKDGWNDATPMRKFADSILQIGDPVLVKKVQKWAEEERQKQKDLKVKKEQLVRLAKKEESKKKMTLAMLCRMCIFNPDNNRGKGKCTGKGVEECSKHFEEYQKEKYAWLERNK